MNLVLSAPSFPPPTDGQMTFPVSVEDHDRLVELLACPWIDGAGRDENGDRWHDVAGCAHCENTGRVVDAHIICVRQAGQGAHLVTRWSNAKGWGRSCSVCGVRVSSYGDTGPPDDEHDRPAAVVAHGKLDRIDTRPCSYCLGTKIINGGTCECGYCAETGNEHEIVMIDAVAVEPPITEWPCWRCMTSEWCALSDVEHGPGSPRVARYSVASLPRGFSVAPPGLLGALNKEPRDE